MKNPFRTRFAVVSERLLPKYLEIEDSRKWYVVCRKWWQRHWYYAQTEYCGFSGMKIPKVHDSKADAIASITIENIN